MLKLYDHPLSGNSYKSRLTLSHLGVEYERICVDVFKGEQHSAEFTTLNPNNKIPVLVDGGFVIWESNAIPLYLAKKYAPNPIFPEDIKCFGLVAQWLLFGKTTIDPNLAMARALTRFVSPEERDDKELDRLRTQGRLALNVLDGYLRNNDFLARSYSIADICCYPYVNLAEEGGVSLSGYPSVLAWCKRIQEQPGYVSMED